MLKLRSNLLVFLCSFLIITTLCSCSGNQNTNNYSNDNATIVYITKTGTKYHRSSCRHLSKSKIEIDLEEAQTKGYGRCSVCKPPTE